MLGISATGKIISVHCTGNRKEEEEEKHVKKCPRLSAKGLGRGIAAAIVGWFFFLINNLINIREL